MRTLRESLIVVAGMLLAGHAALALAAPKEVAAEKPGPAPSLPVLGDMVKSAADLRKAAESFERAAEIMRGLSPVVVEGMVKGSENLAAMTRSLDPFGFKTAFLIIQEQSRTIQALQQAEIDRLKEECRRLSKNSSETQPPRKRAGPRKGKTPPSLPNSDR